MTEMYEREQQRESYLRPFHENEEYVFGDEGLEELLRSHAIAKSLKSRSSQLSNFGFIFDHTPEGEHFCSDGTKLKGLTVGDGEFSLALTYNNGCGYEPFCILGADFSFDEGLMIKQLQGITKDVDSQNITDPHFNRKLLSMLEWDSLLVDLFEEYIVSQSPFGNYFIQGGKNNPWLEQTRLNCSKLTRKISRLDKDEFYELSDRKLFKKIRKGLNKITRQNLDKGSSFDSVKALCFLSYVHLTPERARKRYDSFALKRDAIELNEGDYLVEL